LKLIHYKISNLDTTFNIHWLFFFEIIIESWHNAILYTLRRLSIGNIAAVLLVQVARTLLSKASFNKKNTNSVFLLLWMFYIWESQNRTFQHWLGMLWI